MMRTWMNTWRKRTARARQPQRSRTSLPRLEALEARELLATFNWRGQVGAGGNLLNVNANWREGVAPPADGTADLVFPDMPVRTDCQNDYVAGSAFRSLLLGDRRGYTIAGNMMSLSNGIIGAGIGTFDQTTNYTLSLGLRVTAPQTFVLRGGNISFTGSSLQLMGNSTLTLNNQAVGVGGGRFAVSAPVSGSGSIMVSGSAQRPVDLGGEGTYSGATMIASGVLRTSGQASVIPDASPVTIQAGMLDLTNRTETIGSLAGTGTVALGTGVLTTGGDNTTTEYAGVIGGTGGVVKQGGGTFRVRGNNTYTGTTAVNGGTLEVNGSLATQSATAVNAGGTLGGTGTVGDVVAAGGTVNPGASPGRLRAGSVRFLGGSTFAAELNGRVAGSGYDQLESGPVTIAGGSLLGSLGFASTLGDSFTVITGPVTGIFEGLPEGARLSIGDGLGGGLFSISYRGSVVLTRVRLAAQIQVEVFGGLVFGQSILVNTSLTAGGYGGTALQFRGAVTLVVDGVARPPAPVLVPNVLPIQFTVAGLGVGAHGVTVAFSGDDNFLAGNSTPFGFQVSRATTSTAVAASPGPSVFGQQVVFTATITAVGAVPAGVVAFRDGAQTLGIVPLNAAGQVTLATSTLRAGARTITVDYDGNPSFAASSGSMSQTVNRATTRTTLTCAPSSVPRGQALTFTAAIETLAPGAGSATGPMIFTIDGRPQPPVELVGDRAALTTTTLEPGTYTVNAAYAGQENLNGSASSLCAVQVLPDVPGQVLTTTTLVSSLNPARAGEEVTFTATVRAVSGAMTPSGQVTFRDGERVLGETPLNATGQARLAVRDLTAGARDITAAYAGVGNFLRSAGTVTQTVTPSGETVTAVISSRPTVVRGLEIVFTATVRSLAGGTTPAGQATFRDGDRELGRVALDASGQARLAIRDLAAGLHAITVSYGGGAGFVGSTSTAVTQRVGENANQTVVYQMYPDFLGREADGGGLANFTNLLQQGGSRAQAANLFLGSTEHRQLVIGELFRKYLGRSPDPTGLGNFTLFLAQGGTVNQVEVILLSSAEYRQTRGGGSNAGVVAALYRDVLGREGDINGRAGFVQMLDQGQPTASLAPIFVGSGENLGNLVRGYYERYLRRPADAGGVAVFAEMLRSGTRREGVIAFLAASDEYFQRLS